MPGTITANQRHERLFRLVGAGVRVSEAADRVGYSREEASRLCARNQDRIEAFMALIASQMASSIVAGTPARDVDAEFCR